MKYAFIQRQKLVWPICVHCRLLLVPSALRSGCGENLLHFSYAKKGDELKEACESFGAL